MLRGSGVTEVEKSGCHGPAMSAAPHGHWTRAQHACRSGSQTANELVRRHLGLLGFGIFMRVRACRSLSCNTTSWLSHTRNRPQQVKCTVSTHHPHTNGTKSILAPTDLRLAPTLTRSPLLEKSRLARVLTPQRFPLPHIPANRPPSNHINHGRRSAREDAGEIGLGLQIPVAPGCGSGGVVSPG